MVLPSKQVRRRRSRQLLIKSTSSRKEESDSDEDMALFIKRFKIVMKKDGYCNKDKRSKIKRKSNKPCFGCREIGHFIADCPNPKNKNKNEKKEYSKSKKKYSGEAHLGQE
jgi:hypothetical protein